MLLVLAKSVMEYVVITLFIHWITATSNDKYDLRTLKNKAKIVSR